MVKRGIKKGLLCLLVSVMALTCVSCGSQEKDDDIVSEKSLETFTVTIPENFFAFTNSEAEDTVKGYEGYCVDSKLENGNVVLELTEVQKDNLISMNEQFIQDTLEEFSNENNLYTYELDEDYKKIIYSFDEKLGDTNPVLLGKVLMGVTSMHVLNGILETGNSEWNIEMVIKNCHTGHVVAQGTLPEGNLRFDAAEWEASY